MLLQAVITGSSLNPAHEIPCLAPSSFHNTINDNDNDDNSLITTASQPSHQDTDNQREAGKSTRLVITKFSQILGKKAFANSVVH